MPGFGKTSAWSGLGFVVFELGFAVPVLGFATFGSWRAPRRLQKKSWPAKAQKWPQIAQKWLFSPWFFPTDFFRNGGGQLLTEWVRLRRLRRKCREAGAALRSLVLDLQSLAQWRTRALAVCQTALPRMYLAMSTGFCRRGAARGFSRRE